MDASNPTNLRRSNRLKAAAKVKLHDREPSNSPQQQQKLRNVNCAEPRQRVQRGEMHVSCLPTEVLARVFQLLPVRDRCRAALVCTRWRDLVYFKSPWNDVMITLNEWPANSDDANLLMYSLLLRGVRNLKTCDHTVLSEMSLGLPNLYRVVLSGYQLSPETWSEVMLKRMSNLVHLDFMEPYGVTDETIELLAAHLNKLVVLNLNHCKLITNSSLQHIIRGLPELKQLTLLGCTGITETGLLILSGFRLGRRLDRWPQLHYLNLRDCNSASLSDSAISHLSRGHPSITRLRLSNLTALTDGIFKGLTNMRGLDHLDISGTNLNGSGLLELVDALSPLTHLDLSRCQLLTDQAMEHVGRLKQLRALAINLTSVSDAGLELLVNGGDSPVSSLQIWGCDRITEDGMRHVAKLQQLRQLIYLVGDRGLLHLADGQSQLALVMCRSDLTDAGLRHLATLTGVRNLYLSRCSAITDAGFEEFVANARSPISDLCLHHRDFWCKSLGASTLSCAARGLPTLAKLWLHSGHVDDDGKVAAARHLGRLQYLLVDGVDVTENMRAYGHADVHVDGLVK